MRQTTDSKAARPRYAVLIDPIKPDQSYDNRSQPWELQIVAIDPDDEKPRNCSRGSYGGREEGDIFEDLRLRVHFSWYSDYDGHTPAFQANSFSVDYRSVYSVDLQTLEVLRDGLKKYQRIVAGFPIQPETFGQFVCLIAAGFGVRECVRKYGELGNRCSSYLDHQWQVLPIASAQRIIDEELERVRAIVAPAAVPMEAAC